MPRVYTQTYGVAGAIIEKGGRFLLVQENQPTHPEAYHRWSQPAGWIDVGESPVAACEREVKEETGLDFVARYFLGVYSLCKKYPDPRIGGNGYKHGIKLIFTGEFSGKLVKPRPGGEISARRWFTPEEIYTMKLDVLRDVDIKQEIKDYLAGKFYPLALVKHIVSE